MFKSFNNTYQLTCRTKYLPTYLTWEPLLLGWQSAQYNAEILCYLVRLFYVLKKAISN
jgi:hypothetical protein